MYDRAMAISEAVIEYHEYDPATSQIRPPLGDGYKPREVAPDPVSIADIAKPLIPEGTSGLPLLPNQLPIQDNIIVDDGNGRAPDDVPPTSGIAVDPDWLGKKNTTPLTRAGE
jgi:hypothetical protein